MVNQCIEMISSEQLANVLTRIIHEFYSKYNNMRVNPDLQKLKFWYLKNTEIC